MNCHCNCLPILIFDKDLLSSYQEGRRKEEEKHEGKKKTAAINRAILLSGLQEVAKFVRENTYTCTRTENKGNLAETANLSSTHNENLLPLINNGLVSPIGNRSAL
jgi:hypothetical protein